MITLLGHQITFVQIVYIIFGIGILVFVHELGHFIFAKKYGKVEKFTLGFGPEIIGFTKNGTRYAICAIPLGGMTKMPGESIETSTGAEGEFYSLPWWKRLIIAVSGPAMNYILAIVLFTIVIYFWGLANPINEPIIGEVIENKPAAKSGLQPGDIILSIDDIKINTWEQMAEIIQKTVKKKLKFSIERNKNMLIIYIEPEFDPNRKVSIIGIKPGMKIEKVSFIKSVDYGIRAVIFQSIFTVKYLLDKLLKWETPEVAGPIGVAKILAEAARLGWDHMLNILAVISVALGLFNLFPIPLVDGGHILFSIIEGITKKHINKKFVEIANFVGLGLIILIFIFATYSDLARLGLKLIKQ